MKWIEKIRYANFQIKINLTKLYLEKTSDC